MARSTTFGSHHPGDVAAKVQVFAELYRKTTQLARLNGELEHRNGELQRETAERQRLECEAQRVRILRLLGRLAAGLSHEIRNPLAAVFLHMGGVGRRTPTATPAART